MMRNKKTSNPRNPKDALEDELATLKKLIPFDHATNLTVFWTPNPDSPKLGEVKNHKIFLYDSNLEAAISTLKHEYLDYYLSKRLISPLIAIVNLFIELKTNEVYREKERVVESLIRFIDLPQDSDK